MVFILKLSQCRVINPKSLAKIELTPREAKILARLSDGEITPAEKIYYSKSSCEVTIKNLREKGFHICTKSGVGYWLKDEVFIC